MKQATVQLIVTGVVGMGCIAGGVCLFLLGDGSMETMLAAGGLCVAGAAAAGLKSIPDALRARAAK